MLYIIATPIGNLKDISLRALEILQSVDGIICEDTRRTSILLNTYSDFVIPAKAGIQKSAENWIPDRVRDDNKKPLIVLNNFNEARTFESIIDRLKSGEDLALVSDAGTPLISDPGYKLVRAALENNIEVDSIPGPVSPIVALTLSGLPPDKFLFLGYPPEKSGQRQNFFKKLVNISGEINMTFIMLVSPHKLIKDLADMKEVFGDIEVVLAKELTKIYQNVDKKKISGWLETSKNPKGEYILLFRL